MKKGDLVFICPVDCATPGFLIYVQILVIGDFNMPLQRSLLLSLLAFNFFDITHEGNKVVLLLNIRKSGLRSSTYISKIFT